MKIGIDARFYGPNVGGGGLGRYVAELLDRLDAQKAPHTFVVFLNEEGFRLFKPKGRHMHKRVVPVRWYTFAEQIRMPAIIDRECCDLVHIPHWNVPLCLRTPFVVTIHDLILMEERRSARAASLLPPGLFEVKRMGYRAVLHHALWKSRRVIAVSDFTRARIMAHFPKLPPEKISVIHEGAPGEATGGAGNRRVAGPYFLYVGNAYPHKNLESLLHAFSFFVKAHPEVKLVLAGKTNVFYERLRKELEEIAIPSSSVVFTGFVSDEDLADLYRFATACLFPSRHEGFGLPPLEAMSHGTPVAASSTSAFPEILGDAALFFDPDDLEAMVRIMEKLLQDQALRQELIQKGRQQKKHYSWDTMAERTRRLYEESL
ncbi:glycosyltransferase family 4 protein [Candidatus Uhrbacteria bacterium]|nr:glycosyltransferase family 4 protein [Candidatus Uhrbacteria bacterium]